MRGAEELWGRPGESGENEGKPRDVRVQKS